MSACRALETPTRVAYLGPAGTFSEQAAVQFFGASIEHVPCASFDEVFHAATSGAADFGVVPVENNTEGVVTRSLDLFLRSPVHVVGEVSLLIERAKTREAITDTMLDAIIARRPALGMNPCAVIAALGKADRAIEHERLKESPLGNLVADSVRDFTHADVVLLAWR